LNSVIGLAIAAGEDDEIGSRLQAIQNDLFDVGADLCVPQTDADESAPTPLRVTAEQVTTLETWIDDANERLEPLSSFVLPGGTLTAAHLHLARTVCRRVEIDVLTLAARDKINPQVAIYLNRLSDLLFVHARAANDNGRDDVLWVPGQNRG
jgi:cob(I)alamin adenosyltransferase